MSLQNSRKISSLYPIRSSSTWNVRFSELNFELLADLFLALLISAGFWYLKGDIAQLIILQGFEFEH